MQMATAASVRKRFGKPFAAFGCRFGCHPSKSGGGGWESNAPQEPQQRPANGFEERGAGVHRFPTLAETAVKRVTAPLAIKTRLHPRSRLNQPRRSMPTPTFS